MPLHSANQVQTFVNQDYDYVIIGAGTAGLALATRLSEDPNVSVGVIEAGEDIRELDEVTTPGLFGALIMHPKHDWNMVSVPQQYSNNVVSIQSRGKALGGSSAINFMLTGRAHKVEYDGWEKLGNKGWNWPEMLRYFKKAESLTLPSAEYSSKHRVAPQPQYHGTDGPIKKSHARWISNAWDPLRRTLSGFGVTANSDPDSGDNYGTNVGILSVDPDTLTRTFSTAYLAPNATRTNLNVLTGAQATQILFSGSGKGEGGVVVADGVMFLVEGKEWTVRTKNEVIVCAGALRTPQLLELSGIGPRAVLEKHGIHSWVDLPVGENLQEHYCAALVYEMHRDYDTLAMNADEAVKEKQLYDKERTGRLTSGPASTAWISVPHILQDSLQGKDKLYKLFDEEREEWVAQGKGGVYELYKEWLDDSRHGLVELIHLPSLLPGASVTPEPGKNYQSLLLVHAQPLSIGCAHISSSNASDNPTIDPAHYKSAFDLELMIQSIKFIRLVAKTAPYSDTIVREILPGPEVQSDEELKEYCKNSMTSMYHGVGTTPMLPRENGGVVDDELRVYGTKGLRVVDGGVIPFQLTCHMQMTIYAIAEKAADIIKASRRRP